MADRQDCENYEYLELELSDTENIIPDDSNLNSQVFEEILILEVQERPCLWDQKLDIKMRGINIIRKAWEEVGRALNENPKICQKKWKNLRDTFLRKYKDEKSYTASGSAATNKIMTWKYYKQMEFLKPTTEHRRTFSNVQIVKDVNEEFHTRNNTDTQICIEDEISPSLLTVQDKRKYINTSSICKSSPSNQSSTSSSSTSCSSLKRKNFETININSPKFKKTRTEYPDRFESFIMEQVAQPPSEAAMFCNFLKTRLEKLGQQYYLEATHNIMNVLMRLETQTERETSARK